MKILIARFSHETNTFSPVPTPLASFFEGQDVILGGNEAVMRYRNTGTTLGAFLALAEAEGAAVVLPVAAGASPSDRPDDEAFETIAGLIVDAARTNDYDAMFLDLHGAMATRQYDDPEGELLRRIRSVAPDVPIAVSLDMHANISDETVSRAQVIAGYQTYPHVDNVETARRAGVTMLRALKGEVTPTMAWGNAPMLPHVMAQGTLRSPNRELQAMCAALEASGEALVASVFTGFPHADVPQAGLSAVVVTDNDPALAQRLVDRLLDAAWAVREDFVFRTEPLSESVARARTLSEDGGTVVMLDHCDNSASGGSMDTTVVLAEIIRQGLTDVVFFGICDPAAVQAAVAAGIGARVTLDIGGRYALPSVPGENRPLRVSGVVKTLSNGEFVSHSKMRAGLRVRIGTVAVLDTGDVEIVLVSRPIEPSDLGLFRIAGIDPALKRYVAIKSRVHWAADLGALAKHVVPCNGLGVCTSDYSVLTFEKVRRPIFPLDPVESRLG
jgi:microcystin degradation protein MlrC